MRAILHQIPYYIPPVMIANLINIGIFAFMMGFIEVFPNLLAIIFGSGKNMSLPLNVTELSETSGDLLPLEEGDAERSLPGELVTGLYQAVGCEFLTTLHVQMVQMLLSLKTLHLLYSTQHSTMYSLLSVFLLLHWGSFFSIMNFTVIMEYVCPILCHTLLK